MSRVVAIEVVDKASGKLVRSVDVSQHVGNTDDVWRALDRTIDGKRQYLREVFDDGSRVPP